ncbi:putative RecQ-mediated genome instability protein [Aspergillus sclerotioniger CBS 115572]|uniref:RecQ-mediated genome instability protein 1 n=1 Tax=Aspergillus sclerotioniger CBS 115572 TaxID=1450535 RepID=A0A317WNG7_9EURO|nr:putative RecQ-mediated genome instability protein [Aspergillus sclerotioniger CBS 115572]PWY88014.1 putative RecQ-mediated genome instability protein [Aspergillus sclerotioniger CBS 115572]
MTTPQAQIAAHLQTTKSLSVSATWLNSFVSSAALQRNIPLSALTQTALFRILASDFRDSLATGNPSSLFPVDIFDPTVQECRLQGPIPVQVLDIEDIGTSLWSQVEAIERVERGEAIRGREIVRTEDGASGANDTGNASNGPHRLILQDAAGTRAVGIELARVDGVALNKLPIGAKMVLRNATVGRGMILLTPECTTVLGGKIEGMDQAWKEGRKDRLLARIAGTGEGQT